MYNYIRDIHLRLQLPFGTFEHLYWSTEHCSRNLVCRTAGMVFFSFGKFCHCCIQRKMLTPTCAKEKVPNSKELIFCPQNRRSRQVETTISSRFLFIFSYRTNNQCFSLDHSTFHLVYQHVQHHHHPFGYRPSLPGVCRTGLLLRWKSSSVPGNR